MTSDQAGATLDLRVLGTFAVLYQGQPLALPPSKKTRALLAYLAVVDQPQRRERLCTMFWDAPDDLKGALRWSLSKIRQIVNVGGQDVLAADRNEVALKSESIAVDLRQIRELAQHPPASDTAALEEAAGLLKGGFLADLSLPRCPEFEAWRVSEANGVDLLRARILRTLVDRLAPEPFRALPHAQALLAMDPANGALAAEVTTLTELARELAMKAPTTINAEAPPLAAGDTGAAAAAKFVDGEPQHVTVLSIEIVSPLHGFASVNADVVLRQMDPLFESTHGIVERHGGIITASGNSGITALFGSANGENHAADACRVALAVKSTIEAQSEGSVRVRAGLDSGEVIVRFRRHGKTERIEVTGAAVRTAERLVHSLRRGVLALTDRTHGAAAGLMEMGILPRSDFPRFGRDEKVYELLSETDRTPI